MLCAFLNIDWMFLTFIVYFIEAARNGWMSLAAGVVGAAGLYWLWDEHINAGRRPDN